MTQTQQLQDNCVTLYDISWEKFEAIAALLEDTKVRLTYLDGSLEIMTPSPEHEEYKSTIGLLLVLTSGGVEKLEKYRRWGVPEVWFYRNRQLFIYHLRSNEYKQTFRSEFLPDLDLDLLVRCLNMPDQYDATVAFTQALQQQN